MGVLVIVTRHVQALRLGDGEGLLALAELRHVSVLRPWDAPTSSSCVAVSFWRAKSLMLSPCTMEITPPWCA